MSETPDPGEHQTPATYRFATAIPGALGYEPDDLDRLLSDTFEYGEQTVGLVINGTGEPKAKTIGDGDDAIALPIYAGSVFVVIDGTPTVTLTPTGGEWFIDPFEGGRFGPDHPVGEVERYLLEALHSRLTELGEELPDVDELIAAADDDPEVATDGGSILCSQCQTPLEGEYNLDERGRPKCPDCPYHVGRDGLKPIEGDRSVSR